MSFQQIYISFIYLKNYFWSNYYMKKIYLFLAFFLFLFFFQINIYSQTLVTVVKYDSTQEVYAVDISGNLSFDADNLIVTSSSGEESVYIERADIRKLLFSEGTNSFVDNNSTNLNISVFPNPGKDNITINSNLQNVNFDIYNINGKTVKSGIISDKNQVENISDLDAGIYFIRVNNSNIKFIKF